MSDYTLDLDPNWNWIEYEKIEEPPREPSIFWRRVGQIQALGCVALATDSLYTSQQRKKKGALSLASRDVAPLASSEVFSIETIPFLAPPSSPAPLPKSPAPRQAAAPFLSPPSSAQRKSTPSSSPKQSASTPSLPLTPPAPLDFPEANKLRCTLADREKIAFVVRTIGGSYAGLAANIAKLYQIQEEILPVHPFCFLWTIFSDKSLREIIRDKVYDKDAATRPKPTGWRALLSKIPTPHEGFMGGVNRGMSREIENLDPLIPSFAASLGLDAQEVKRLIQEGAISKNWVALVGYLCQIKET